MQQSPVSKTNEPCVFVWLAMGGDERGTAIVRVNGPQGELCKKRVLGLLPQTTNMPVAKQPA